MNGHALLQRRSGAATECGPRPVNQDGVLISGLPTGEALVAVADGMGGLHAGEVASRLALEALRDTVAGGQGLEYGVRSANTAVHAAAATDPARAGMGTTLVALLCRGDEYVIANVGDSRAYRVDDAGIRQLTRDHSFVAEATASGQLTPGAAEQSPWRNAVTRAIGTDAQVEVDSFGPFDGREAHRVLLCTDGVYRVLSEERLGALCGAGDPPAAARALCAAAIEAGTGDNATAAVVHFGVEDGASAAPGGPVIAPMPAPLRRSRPQKRGRWRSRQKRRWAAVQLLLVLAAAAGLSAWIYMLWVKL